MASPQRAYDALKQVSRQAVMGRRFDRSQFKVTMLTDEDILEKLRHFEAKYGMSSAEFYPRYNRGDLPEQDVRGSFEPGDDFMEWKFYYDAAFHAGLIAVDMAPNGTAQ